MHKDALYDNSKFGLCWRMPRCDASAEKSRAVMSAHLVIKRCHSTIAIFTMDTRPALVLRSHEPTIR